MLNVINARSFLFSFVCFFFKLNFSICLVLKPFFYDFDLFMSLFFFLFFFFDFLPLLFGSILVGARALVIFAIRESLGQSNHARFY